MDPSEDFARPEEMTMLTHEDVPEENIDPSDEVESLQQSFLEAVHDESVQPKMQCLMMDSSFSMVTVQGEDSGIEWETTPSRCPTPWHSEAGGLSADVSISASTGTIPAGKIIFVMDEELISKQKKTKEKDQGAKAKADMYRGISLGSLDNISRRPELVSFSEPNVKPDLEEFEEEVEDLYEDKEQKLFRLVSEGSEILNIIAPSKVATVDEEESREMEDNLSYLEACNLIKAQEDIPDLDLNEGFTAAPLPPVGLPSLDPPGAPVPKPSAREQSNVDYFEAFALTDAQAPGGPVVSEQEQNKATEALRPLETETLGHAKGTSRTSSMDQENEETMSLVEITSELLDEVFYGNTGNYSKTERATDKSKPTRLSLKSTGSTLFGSQEDVLTPIYLPEGPPKIIDPILLEEPKAMAFLYTDLYEEATGCRLKEEDTESLSSEKSFHSRHSDREARGYLEKYVLIDETPVVEVEQKEQMQCPKDSSRTITQDLYEFGDMVSKPDKNPLPDSEELTDFFRSSASSSPCVLEPSSHLDEDDEAQTETKNKTKTKKKIVKVVEPVSECTIDSLSEFLIDDPDWERTFDISTSVPEKENTVQQQPLEQHKDIQQQPVAPPRRKTSALQKSSLDLAPLTPVFTQEETETASKLKEEHEEEKKTAKEEREEEKETAEGGDVEEEKEIPEGGDVEETGEVALSQDTNPFDDIYTDGLNVPETEVTVSVSNDEGTTLCEKNETLESNEPEKTDQVPTETVNKDTSDDAAKGKGQCIIL